MEEAVVECKTVALVEEGLNEAELECQARTLVEEAIKEAVVKSRQAPQWRKQ